MGRFDRRMRRQQLRDGRKVMKAALRAHQMQQEPSQRRTPTAGITHTVQTIQKQRKGEA